MTPVVVALGVGGALAIAAGLRSWIRTRVLRRLADEAPIERPEAAAPATEHRGLRGWLGRAGFRSRRAEAAFHGAVAVALTSGALVFIAFDRTQALERAQRWAHDAPGLLASLALPLIAAAPFVVCLMLLALPVVFVRARRSARVAQIEEDLPAVLELLAAMARAGLGFAAGISRLIDSESEDRALIHELALLQRDGLAGIPRADALRRMAERIDVPTVSTFCSALIHAENAGIGLAEMLRQQADDLRGRRREQALLKAQSLPVKLVFPLVICFLPGLFVFTLGPAFATFFQLADQIVESNR